MYKFIYDEMKEYIRKSKFVVVPSIWYENCPYSIIETLAIGKPIIGSNIAGIPELVQNNVNGFTFEYNNIEELKQKMQILFNDNMLVENFSKKSKQIGKELYSKESYYNEIIKIYSNLIRGRKIDV